MAMYCTSCGRELEERMAFCPRCGAPIKKKAQEGAGADSQMDSAPETIPKTPTALLEETAAIPEVLAASLEEPGRKVPPADSARASRKKRGRKILFAGLAAVVAAAACAAVFLWLKKPDRVYFLKDNGIWTAVPGKEKAKVVGGPVFANPDVTAYDMVEVEKTADGRFLLFPMNMDAWRGTYDLACAGPGNKQPVRLGTNVRKYQVIGSEGVYCLGQDGSLLYIDLKGEQKPVAEGVTDFLSSDDGQTVVCLKDNCLTVVGNGGEEKQIDESASKVTVTDLNGAFKIYYEKQREQIDTWYYYDFVKEDFDRKLRTEDPLSERDAYNNMEEIQRFWGVQTVSQTDLDYYEDLGAVILRSSYQMNRDQLMQTETRLQGQWNRVDLMVYDGGTEECRTIAEGLLIASTGKTDSRISVADGPYVSAFQCLDKENMPVYGVADIAHMNWDEAQVLLDRDIAAAVSLWVQWEESVVKTDVSGSGYEGLLADAGAKESYILTGLDGEYEGVKAVIRQPCGQEGGEAEIMDMEVDSLAGMTGKQLYYFKETEPGRKSLYHNGVQVASNVPGRIELTVGNRVYYMTDYDTGTGEGTLCCYDGRETEKIASGVHHIWPVKEKGILLLTDYSQYYDRGTLQYYDGKELRPVEEKAGWVLDAPAANPE